MVGGWDEWTEGRRGANVVFRLGRGHQGDVDTGGRGQFPCSPSSPRVSHTRVVRIHGWIHYGSGVRSSTTRTVTQVLLARLSANAMFSGRDTQLEITLNVANVPGSGTFRQKALPSDKVSRKTVSLVRYASSLSRTPQEASRVGNTRITVCFSSLVTANVVEKLKDQEQEALLPMDLDVEGIADDPSVHNPLVRMNRLGTGWFGVIMEYEGVIVESLYEEHKASWLQIAEEFGYPKPLGHLFRRIRGCRDELVIKRIFNWTQNPTTVKMLAERKTQIFDELVGRQPATVHEVFPFLQMLRKLDIPVALVCPMTESKVKEALQRHGLSDAFDAVVTAEDSGAAEVEFLYMIAASQLQRPPMRTIVVGESNTSVEAAHELGMKCVIPTGHRPVYDYVGADLVVRNLGQIAFLNLKKLFAQEDLVRPRTLIMQEEEESVVEADIVDEDWGFEEEEDEINMPFNRSRGAFL
eukprot:gene13972-19915_t